MDQIGCLWLPLVLLITVIIYTVVQHRARRQAEAEYRHALATLRSDPGNPHLRTETLELGRKYSNLTRNSRGVTLFDEVALMNDINAACASTSVAAAVTAGATTVRSIEERLRRLNELKARGAVDQREYETSRARILDEV